jgi:hypothetical protein
MAVGLLMMSAKTCVLTQHVSIIASTYEEIKLTLN